MGPFERIRKRLAAWLVARGSAAHAKRVEARRAALLGPLGGRVLEIGPGAGTNRACLDPSVRWIGIEPNPYMIEAFRARHGGAGLLSARAEALPIASGSVDAVLSTLVLCSVAEPARVLAEIRRVLKPGAPFVFLEHGAGRPGSFTCLVQRLVGPAWRAIADGCSPDRDVRALIEAAGFARLELESFDLPLPIVGPHVAGRALA